MQSKQNSKVLLISLFIAVILGGAAIFLLTRDSDATDSTDEITQETESEESETESDSLSTDDEDTTTSDETDLEEDEETIDEEESEEITIPEMEDLQDFLPEGGQLVLYWWEYLNDDEYNEVIIAYNHEDKAKLMALGVEDNEYKTLWDQEVPGRSVSDLEVSDRNGDGVVEIVVWTTQGSSGYMNLYHYSDDGPTVMILRDGSHDGENTEISWNTAVIEKVELGDTNENGKDDILLYLPGQDDTQIYDHYEWDGTDYSFLEQATVEPEEAEEEEEE